MKKNIITVVLITLCIVMFSCCNANTLQHDQEKHDAYFEEMISEEKTTIDSESTIGDPYLSITYARNNSNSLTGTEIVFYSYDINTNQLKEECVLPFDSSYASGVVSKYDNAVYYSGNTIPGDYSSGNSLWMYKIDTGESVILDNEDHAYNDILLIDPNTLLVMMVTDAHPIMPVLFDLPSKTFTYMADANNEPFIWTSGATTPFYNYLTKQFTCIYWNDNEDSGDNGYTSLETAIDHYLTLVSSESLQKSEKIFTHRARIDEFNMMGAVQLSENELLVTMINQVYTEESPEYYLLVFEEDKTTFTKTECPYPHADYVSNLYTIDGGKVFFFYLYNDYFGNPDGVYSYDTETKELSPILLNDSKTNGRYVNFSIVGP